MNENKKILLSSAKSKTSVNDDILLNIDISSDEKKLPSEDITANIDQYKQYIKEKDKSNKYRFVFTINPVCTNVLYNHITEITEETSSNIYFYGLLGKSISYQNNKYVKYKYGNKQFTANREGLIRDTGFSHKECGNFTYNCGVDIFNNHLFRHDGFIVISQKKSGKTCPNFNTISDVLREYDGSTAKTVTNGGGETDCHLYNRGTFKSYVNALRDNLIERDGWFGFINQTGIDIKNFEQDGVYGSINKVINNRKACEFIDLYPDRTLFSFIPKKNNRLKREEFNWDYCITYPYANYDKNRLVSLLGLDGKPVLNGLLTNFCESNGNEMYVDDIIKLIGTEEKNEFTDVLLRTKIKNNIISGDNLRVHLVAISNGLFSATHYTIKSDIKVRTTGVGGYNSNYYFSINRGDLVSGLRTVLKLAGYGQSGVTITNVYCYIQRISNGRPCKYYYRIFRRLPNFKNTSEYNINKITDAALNKVCLNNFDSSLNKLGFGNNIYGDRMAQIVFNDDVDTTNITDNLGRPLHELFLTIIKANRGNILWYIGKKYSDDKVEYSHCFSPLTSGLDMPWPYDGPEPNDDYNVHKIHNVAKIRNINGGIFPKSVEPLETGITNSGSTSILGSGVKGVFLGDIVELDELNVEEYVLENVQHRFNTMQREYFFVKNSFRGEEFDNEFKNIKVDDILSDDFDGEFLTGTTNLIEDYYLNIAPEGYYYNAHYRIPIRQFSEIVNEGQHTIVKVDNVTTCEFLGKYTIKIRTDKNYYFQISDKLYIYDKNNNRYIVTIVNVEGVNFTQITFESLFEINGNNLKDFKFFKPNSEMPSTAYDFNDGSGVYKWRDIESFEFVNNNSEVFNDVFTNGAHYIHKNINFFLRRQDPYGLYGLNPRGNDNFPYEYQLLEQIGNEKDVTPAEHFTDGDTQLC